MAPQGKVRVVQLGVYPPPNGGVQTNVAAIHKRLLENGHEGYFINLSRHRQQDTDRLFFPASAGQVCRLLTSLPVDIAHIHIGGDITPRLVALGEFLRLLPRKKVVCTLHSGGYPGSVAGKVSLHLRAIRLVFRQYNALVAVNQELVEFWASTGIAREKVHLIEPFPRLKAADLSDAFQPAVQGFCETHSPLLLTVGLLEPEYDLPLQIAMLPQIRERHPQAGLMIVGSGSLQEELTRRIAAEPASESILLAGDQPRPNTLALIRRANVLLRTTLYDGDSVAVREAIQLGTPVVGTDNGMRPAQVILAPIGDIDAVAQRVLAVLQAPRSENGWSPEIAQHGDGIDRAIELYQSL